LHDDIEDVTADEMQEVAAKIFRPGNMTVGVLRSPAVGARENGDD
jgi:predicted Zn-dependent peptidase